MLHTLDQFELDALMTGSTLLDLRRDGAFSDMFAHKLARRAHGLSVIFANLSRQIGYAPEPKPGSNVVELSRVRSARGR
jgi:hypothetical protein